MQEQNKSQPLKVERSQVTKLHISGAYGLDPITVFLEDFAPKHGKITVSCYDKTWHATWGGMWDGMTVGQFFCQLDVSYIIGYFDRQLSSRRYSGEAVAAKAKQLIIELRRERELDRDDARELFDEAEDVRHTNSMDHLGGAYSQFMEKVFGDEWWILPDDAEEPNPEWTYLCRIITTVQLALQQYEQSQKIERTDREAQLALVADQVVGRVYHTPNPATVELNSSGRTLPDGAPLYARPADTNKRYVRVPSMKDPYYNEVFPEIEGGPVFNGRAYCNDLFKHLERQGVIAAQTIPEGEVGDD